MRNIRKDVARIMSIALVGAVLAIMSGASLAEVKLTPKIIENWLAATPKIEEFGNKHEKVLEVKDDKEQSFADAFEVENMLKPIREAGLYDELEDLVDDYDFDSPEEWAGATGKIAKAVMAIQAKDHMSGMNAEMEQQMKAMMNNPDITPEAKQMMQQSMAMSMGMMKSLKDVPESDKKMVEPYLPQITAFFESESRSE